MLTRRDFLAAAGAVSAQALPAAERSDRDKLCRPGPRGRQESRRHLRRRSRQPLRQTKPGPYLSNLVIDGSDTPLSKLIATTERGVLVTRLWYIRMVDPRQALFTGLTRDGLFSIEDGEIRLSHAAAGDAGGAFPVHVDF